MAKGRSAGKGTGEPPTEDLTERGLDANVTETLGPMPATVGSAGCVLLVDDEPVFRASVGWLLTDAGYSVFEAETAEVALAHVDAISFDLVITDVNLPGMSGLELLRHVRERDALVSVILISGDPSAKAIPMAGRSLCLGSMLAQT